MTFSRRWGSPLPDKEEAIAGSAGGAMSKARRAAHPSEPRGAGPALREDFPLAYHSSQNFTAASRKVCIFSARHVTGEALFRR